MILGGIADIGSTGSVKSFANFVGTVIRLPAATYFSNYRSSAPMITKCPYTMKIKPNTRRKYAKNLYWLRKEIAKRSDTVDDTKDGAADEKLSKTPNAATYTAS